MNKSILVVCPYPVDMAPSQRLKYEQYLPLFERAGWKVTVSPFMSQQLWKCVYKEGFLAEKIFWTLYGYARRIRDLFRMRSFQVVYIHLWVTPFGPPIFEWLTRLIARRIVYDIDDLIYIAPASSSNRLIHFLKGRGKPAFLMRRAEQVIVCSPELYRFASEFSDNVTDISSTVDLSRYRPLVEHSEARRITLGWTGSLSTSRYLKLLEPVLKSLAADYDFDILVIGDEDFEFSALECTAIPWRRHGEVEDLRRIDIGLYPLPKDHWVLGKSGLKAIQYMALEIPVVATSIGANFRVIDHGVTGFLVETETQWREALVKLMTDVQLRKRMGKAGRSKVASYFSVEANAPKYLDILESAAGPW